MNIQEVLNRPEYQFIGNKNNKYTTDKNMVFVTFGGSIAYGLNTPNSDIDIRGVCFDSDNYIMGAGFLDTKDNPNIVIGSNGFEQYNDAETDTIIYSVSKFVKLLSACNPNVIEMIGCKSNHYKCFCSYHTFNRLYENYEKILSKRAYETFVGYARGQFQRLKNALGKDRMGEFSRVVSLADSIERMQHHFEQCYPDYRREMLEILITDKDGNPITVNGVKAVASDVSIMFNNNIRILNIRGEQIDPSEVEMRFNINFNNLPQSQFMGVTNEVNTQLKEFTKTIGHRNHKKDDYHLCKHAMHLLRLYMMCYDILTKHKVITYRVDEHDLLMSIKNGAYFNGTTFSKEFFDMVQMYDDRLYDALLHTTLPDEPDKKFIAETIRYWNSFKG